ncbi:MAG TPA: alanine racemase [Nitrolancea sp.]|jgi:D-serine deaminase-like pyridoxal phosphate-dependent protein|nr:alanine racemase [Nitrolancea sp.]
MGYREALDTPCLVVHEEILERNVQAMAEYARSRGIQVRPHQKTHKTAEIARMQLDAGASGATCAKLGEAEALVDSGVFDDILIAYQVVGEQKIQRLLGLMDRAHMIVAVDGPEVAQALSDACNAAGKTLDVVIEVNTGLNRAGLTPGEEVLNLALALSDMSGLRLRGIMTHEGHVAQATSVEELDAVARKAGEDLVATADLLRSNGFAIDIVSAGSTPAAFSTTKIDGITEMRPGTYVFNDNTPFRFGRVGPERCALRILTTVISRPAPDRAVIDAGSKTLAMDPSPSKPGHGYVVEYPSATIVRVSEEHGVIELPEDARDLKVGDRLEVIPNHVCPTVNLQDEMFVVRDGELLDRWDVIGRGKVR